MRKTVPVVSDCLLPLRRDSVAHAPGGKSRISEHLNHQCRIDCARSTVGIRYWEPVAEAGCAALRRWESDCDKRCRCSTINVQLTANWRPESLRGNGLRLLRADGIVVTGQRDAQYRAGGNPITRFMSIAFSASVRSMVKIAAVQRAECEPDYSSASASRSPCDPARALAGRSLNHDWQRVNDVGISPD